MRDNSNRGRARKLLDERLQREEMGDEAYEKYVFRPDRTTTIALFLIFLAVAAIILTLA